MDEGLKFSHMTLSDQLRQSLLQKIATGEWAPGTQVPNEIEIARDYGLSNGTVRKALASLENDKFILRQQGKGTFVLDPAGREVMRRFERFRSEDEETLGQTLEVQSHTVAEGTDTECRNLRLAPGAKVRRMTRLRRHNGKPFLHEEIAIPASLFPLEKEVDNPEHWISTTARNCGVLLGDAEEKISLAACPSAAARNLGLTEGAPVMRIRSVMLTIDGIPARWRDAYCVTDGIYYSVPLTRKY
jgi:GntR family transcriptional regulator